MDYVLVHIRERHSMIPAVSGWMDTKGKVYENPGMLKHWAWIQDNLGMLKSEYGLDLPNDKSAAAELLKAGWTRIFVNDKATEVSLQSYGLQTEQIRSIRRYLGDIGTLHTVYFDYRSEFGMLRCGTFGWREFQAMAEQAAIEAAECERVEKLEKIREVQERL